MSHLNEWFAYVVVALSALSAVASLLPTQDDRSGLKSFSLAALVLAAAALMASLAHPALLPPSSIALQADGSSNDPRIVAALAVGLAAFLGFIPAQRQLKLPLLGAIGAALPGLAIGGVAVSLFYFMQLRSPLALTGILIAGLVVGQAVALLPRLLRLEGQWPGLLVAVACAVLVGAGMLSLHGARVPQLQLVQGATVDTLGVHVGFAGSKSPTPTSRQLLVPIGSGADSTLLRPVLSGASADSLNSAADARLAGGPIIVPLALHEMRRKQPHGIAWVKKGETFDTGAAAVKFVKWRIEKTDSIRMYADLEVTANGRTERVAPGWTAHEKGEVPFSAISKAIGPIAVAGMDADNGRVALMFSSIEAPAMQVALVDLRLRPALPVAWGATIVAIVGLLLALLAPAGSRRRA
ncbi:MAG: hypothetical protein U0704_02115 [Candidatus Eisenbacteria bacterium]